MSENPEKENSNAEGGNTLGALPSKERLLGLGRRRQVPVSHTTHPSNWRAHPLKGTPAFSINSKSTTETTRYPPKINLTAEYTANSGKRSAYADPDDVTAMIDRYAELFAGDCRDITYELVKTILRSNGANTVNIESEGMSVRVPVEIVETVEELKAYINSIDNSNKIRAIGKQLSCNLHTAYLHCIRDSTYAVRKATGFPGIRDAITYIRTRPTDDSCVIAGGARRHRRTRRRSKRRSSRKRRTHSR